MQLMDDLDRRLKNIERRDVPRYVYDVRRYGAKADGVVDDTAAIQAAIDAVPIGTDYSVIVYLPSGMYKITDTLTIPDNSNIELQGGGQAGALGTYIKSTSLADDMIDASLPTVFSIRDMNIIGALGGGGAGNGVLLGSVTNPIYDSVIDNVNFSAIPNIAIKGYPQGFHITNCNFETSNYGIVLQDGSYNIIHNNRIYRNQVAGIQILNGQQNSIVGNMIDENGDDNDTSGGIYLWCTTPEIRNTLIANNTFVKNHNDIVMYGTDTDQWIGTGGNGVNLVKVIGNTSELAERYSIICSDVTHVQIEHNSILDASQDTDNTYVAIAISAACDSVRVHGNTVLKRSTTKTQAGGIAIAATCTNNEITDNVFQGKTNNLWYGAGATFTRLSDNIGYVTRNHGAAANIADGGTIAHGLAATPTRANVSASVSGEFASVTGLDGTNITVAIKKHDNTAGTTQTIYWEAEIIP